MHDAGKSGSEPSSNGTLSPVPLNGRSLPARMEPYGSPGYPNETFDSGEDLSQTIYFYLRIFLKHKWLILGAAALTVSIGALYTLMQTPIYTATARIQIEQYEIKVVESGATDTSNRSGSEFLRTQFELLKSRAMGERVASSLQLEKDGDFFEPRNQTLFGMAKGLIFGTPQTAEPSAVQLQSAASGILANNIVVRPVPRSRLVDIVYSDPSPGRAARVANAYADAYIASNIDKRFEANAYAKTFLEDQIKQLKLRLEASEETLLDFSEKEQIVQVNEKESIAESNLAAANASLGTLISERIKNEQSWKQVENASEINLPQLLTNSVIDGLRGRRNTLATEYEEKLETFKPEYPAMVKIKNQINETDRQILSEVGTIRESLKAAYESSLQQEREMRKRIDQLRSDVLDFQKHSVRHNILKREVDSNRNIYNSLLQRFKEVDVASGVGTNNVFIVDKARTPGEPSSPQLLRALILSLLLGLGGGLALAYLIELLDDRVRSPEDVENLTGLPTLGIVPRVSDTENFIENLNDPHAAIAESYRSLATALQFSTDAGLPRSIVFTSSGPGEGKSSSALAVARHFATIGLKVLLVDGDLRKPSLHTKLGQDNSVGLSNYLTGSVTPPEVIQSTNTPNLAFMATGPLPPNAAELLSGTRVFSLVSVGAEVFDLIIFDAPPLLGLADSQLLASAASATVFVVGAGQQRKGQIRASLNRLQLARAKVIGAIVTKFDSKSAGYGYGYGYGYGEEAYSYGQNATKGKTGQNRLTSDQAVP